jgi:hypothetical protein
VLRCVVAVLKRHVALAPDRCSIFLQVRVLCCPLFVSPWQTLRGHAMGYPAYTPPGMCQSSISVPSVMVAVCYSVPQFTRGCVITRGLVSVGLVLFPP